MQSVAAVTVLCLQARHKHRLNPTAAAPGCTTGQVHYSWTPNRSAQHSSKPRIIVRATQAKGVRAQAGAERLAAGAEDWEVDINHLDIEAKLAQARYS